MYFLGIEASPETNPAPRHPDVWIIVPAFEESSVIGTVIADVRSVFDNVVCVDDGSTDDTAATARRAGAHVVRHPVNLGQGAAIQTGVEFARNQPDARIFATFDADGQHRVADAARMVERLATEDLDIIIGTRFGATPATTHAKAQIPVLKRIVLRTAVRLSPRIRRLGLSDAHNGLRVFNRKVAYGLDITMNGMSHAGEFIALIGENRWRVGEEPIEVLYTDYSKAKGQPLLNGVNIMFDGLLRKRMSR
ncbi:MAG: glycosyltransferase family 2 protein [Mycobacterium sp.]